MKAIPSGRSIGPLVWSALLTLSASLPALAANAIYSVDWVSGNPARIVVKIDTRPWSADTVSRTARVAVRFQTDSGPSELGQYDFLGGLTQPKYLEHGRVYERSFVVNVAGAAGIRSSSLAFPSDEGKADKGAEPTGKTGQTGLTGATTDVLGGVVVPPPTPSSMTYEPQTNRNAMDYDNRTVGSVQECSSLCLADRRCRAFTLVLDDQSNGGMCWLKNAAPAPEGCGNCVSGIKRP
jgi:PAN domain